jgi:fatty-acyl-CoA synthase
MAQVGDLPQVRAYCDILQIEKTPLGERWTPQCSLTVLEATTARSPNAPALTFLMQGDAQEKGCTFSYRALLEKVIRAANVFRSVGVVPGRPVALILPNAPDAHFALWGGETAGAAAPINPLLEPKQIALLLRAMNAVAVVTLAPLPGTDLAEKTLEAVAEAPGVKTIFTVDLSAYLPLYTRLAAKALTKPLKAPSGIQVQDFAKARRAAASRLSFERPDPKAIASLFHTGGTTGHPKIAQHTHANECFDAWAIGSMVHLGPADVIFCGLPLFHVNGAIVTGLAPFMAGAHVVLGPPQGYRSKGLLDQFWAIVEQWRVTSFSGVPTLYASLLERDLSGADISSIRYAVCGAAPMPVDLFTKFEAKTGVKILEGYGLTEATCASSFNPPYGERRIGSIGMRFPYQDMKAVVVDAQGCVVRDCAPNEAGVIAIRGPNVFPGYLSEADNSTIWLDEGWLNTGDLGRQDAEGYFWLTGRVKDLIIRGGHNIDPQMIEEALARHPAVALAAAVGQPDVYAGELPAAFVAVRPGMKVELEELRDFIRPLIAERAALPVHISCLAELPTTAVGKVFKPELRRRAAERVVTEALIAAGHASDLRSVANDPNLGLCVTVSSAAAREALAGFAFQVVLAGEGRRV